MLKKFALAILITLCSVLTHAQNALPMPGPVFCPIVAGLPLVGGKVGTYQSGTFTPQTTYTTFQGNVANSNPVILDGNGCASIWLLSAASYRIVIQNSNNVTLYQIDGIAGLVNTVLPLGVPTGCATGTGAGTGASCSANAGSKDSYGDISATLGTAPAAFNAVLTLTLSKSYTKIFCVVTPGASGSQFTNNVNIAVTAVSGNSFTVFNNGGALPASTGIDFQYHCDLTP